MAMGRREVRTPPRVLFVTAALDAVGGIPSYSRAMVAALERVGETHVVDLSLSGSRRDQLAGFARVLGALGRVRPDLLVLGHVGFGPVGLLWQRLGGRFAVVTYGIEVWGAPSRSRTRTLAGADAVWTISSFTAEEVRRVAPTARLAPVLGGNIDRSFFQEHDPTGDPATEPFRVLVVCRLVDLRHKGLDTVVDAAQLLADDAAVGRPVEVRIAGEGPARGELEQLLAARDRHGVVALAGRLPDDELRAAYRRSDVVLLLSRHERGATPRGEGLGLVVLEGAAAGTTAIASAVGGSTDIVVDGETGFLIEAGDAGLLADRLRVLAADPALARRMGAAAQAFVRSEHTFEAFVPRVRAAVAQTLGHRRVGAVAAGPGGGRPAGVDGGGQALRLHVNAVGAVMGGAQRHLAPFLRALVEQRPAWSIDVWVTDGAPLDDLPPTVRVRPVPVHGQVDRLRFDNVTLPRALRHEGADALLGLTNAAPVRPGVPSVVYQRNALYFDPAWLARLGPRGRAEAQLRRALAFAQLRAADEVLVPSAAMAALLQRWPGFPASCAVHVVPHAVDLERFRFAPGPWPPPGPLHLLHVSHATAHKDQLLLVDLVRLLVDRGIDAHLVATMAREDDPPYVDAFVAHAVERGVRDRIELRGRVPDVERELQAADVMVFPSISESFGFPVIEAMASGVPVVASAIASTRELLGGRGSTFAVGDAAGAADAVVALLGRDPAAVRADLEAANAAARRLTWRANASAVARSIEHARAGW